MPRKPTASGKITPRTLQKWNRPTSDVKMGPSYGGQRINRVVRNAPPKPRGSILAGDATPPPPAGDPNFANVALLLDFESGFNDLSPLDRGVLANDPGDALPSLSTDQVNYGSQSGRFGPGKENLVTAADNSWGTDEWTLEGWYYFVGPTDGNPTLEQSLFGFNYSGSGSCALTAKGNGIVTLQVNGNFAITGTYKIPSETWVHIALTFDGTTHRVYADGNRVIEHTTPGWTMAANRILMVGTDINTWSDTVDYYLDEFRATRGVQRYTGATYDIPTASFPLSA